MESTNNEWIDLIVRIVNQSNDAILILNESYELIFSNQFANSIFSISDLDISLNQIFDPNTVQEISDNIGIVVSSQTNRKIKKFNFKLKGGTSIASELLIEAIKHNGLTKIILIFKLSDDFSDEETISKINIINNPYLASEQKELFDSIIIDIKNNFPFTLVSLDRIKRMIDKIDSPIVVKDTNRKIIAINTSYTNLLAIENSMAIGKTLEAFLPPHLAKAYKMLDEISLSSKQQVNLEFSIKKSGKIETISEYLQFPILNNNNQIICEIGLIIDKPAIKTYKLDTELLLSELVKSFPKPLCVLSLDGIIKAINEDFCKVIEKEYWQVNNKSIQEIFSTQTAEIFYAFNESDQDRTSFRLNKNFVITEDAKFYLEFSLNKIYGIGKNATNILLIISKPDNFEKLFDDLQNLLMYRGKMFDILIEKNPEPIFIYDKENLRFLEVNTAAVNLYGYSRDEFLQMDLTDLYAPEDIQTLLDSFGDESTEARFSKPFRHRKKDGTNVLVKISKTSFLFNDREAHFNIVKDITKEVETDKQNQMLKAIFSEAEMMIFSTDASGFITFVNHKVNEKLGLNANELVQSAFASLVLDEDRGIVNTSIFQSFIKDTIALETKFKTKAGNFLDVEMIASPIFDFDGEVESFTIVVKQKNSNSETDHSKEPIKEVVKEVVKEVIIEKPVKTEQKSLIPDANFLSGMFHEILTPINVIIGFSQELINNTENQTEEQLEAAEIINQNRIKMMDTMNSVVEYSDIIQNKSPLKVEDITITEIIEKLDNNIKDISGINDILFSYGKISSSLKFKSDKQKFESFILSLIKVVSRLSKDKKIYFSAFPLDAEYFVLGISDQYGNPSDYVSNVLEQVYINNRDPKDFGLPKLTSYLSKTLLSLLDGKFYRSSAISVRPETGFIFPIYFTPKLQTTIFTPITESIDNKTFTDEENLENHIDSLPELIKMQSEIQETVIPEQPSVENEKQEPESLPINRNETPVPVENSADESITNIQTVEEYYAAFANEVIAEEIKEAEAKAEEELKTEVEKISSNTESVDQENLVKEIKKELEGDIFAEPETVVSKSVDLSKLNCLYIEDQIDSQILFKVQMKGLNDIKFAAGFEDAQLLLLNHNFDFIVMDINLQGEYNGLDALKIIKTMPAFSSIPVIAVTAYVLPGDKEKFIAAGFDDFISKPIFREKMMESLEKIFLS